MIGRCALSKVFMGSYFPFWFQQRKCIIFLIHSFWCVYLNWIFKLFSSGRTNELWLLTMIFVSLNYLNLFFPPVYFCIEFTSLICRHVGRHQDVNSLLISFCIIIPVHYKNNSNATDIIKIANVKQGAVNFY